MTSAPVPPRALTPEVRAELGLPAISPTRYRWSFAALVVGTACIPLLLAKLWSMCALAFAIGFVIFPFVRWMETRDASWREEVYRSGKEAIGRVLDVEPAGPGRADHIVRVEFGVGASVVRASVIGCPLARRGLLPDDDVLIVYAPERPTRCLVLRKAPRPIVDAIFDD
ncbi:MAG TPA: hypothetical protein VF881_10785 [Polyangiaceae bacterium]